MRWKSIGVLLLGLSVSCTALRPAPATRPPAATPTPARAAVPQQMDEFLTRLTRLGFAGAVWVSEGDTVLLAQGYGEAGGPLTPDTGFSLGSNSKPFTAAAILALQDAGQLSVTDRLDRFFPEAPADKRAITLHQLLTHSAGLDHSGVFADEFEMVDRGPAVQRILARPLLFAPGTANSYSDLGYILLAAVVEVASGQSFQAYVRTAVLAPAGLTATGWWGEADGPGAAAQAAGEHDGRRPADLPSPGWAILGAGGMVSTVRDLQRWHQAMEAGAVLSAAGLAALDQPHFMLDARGGEGYGWQVFEAAPGRRVRASAGGTPQLGHTAFMAWWPDDQRLFIVNAARTAFRAEGVAPVLRAIVEGLPYALPPAVVAVTPETLTTLAGRYTLDSGEHFIVHPAGQTLTITGAGPSAFRWLFPEAPEAAAAQRAVRRLLEAGTDPEIRLLERWQRRQAEALGALTGYAVMGSQRLGGGELWTYVAFYFERGTAYTRWVVNAEGALMGAVYDAAPPLLTVYPVSATRFEAYTLEAPAALTLEFEPAAGQLTVATPAGVLTARRTP